MKDLLLTEEGDLYISNETADVSFTDSVAQAIEIRLRWFLGEWRINRDYGFPWYEEVLGKSPNLDLVRSRVREVMLSVDEVIAIKSLDVNYDVSSRKVKLKFSVGVSQGTETGEVDIDG